MNIMFYRLAPFFCSWYPICGVQLHTAPQWTLPVPIMSQDSYALILSAVIILDYKHDIVVSVKELMDLFLYSTFTPTCFGK
jgi:hypothetical protein